jgi:hypothetical protein
MCYVSKKNTCVTNILLSKSVIHKHIQVETGFILKLKNEINKYQWFCKSDLF